MSEDKREAILARLLVVAGGVPGVKKAFRNQLEIPEHERPAIVILDADESVDPDAYGRKRPANGPLKIGMTPEIYMLLDGDSDSIGTAINTMRRALIKAVLTDELLVAACHDGDIRYDGFATGLAAGRSMEGEAGISFTFNYMLRPSQL